MTATITHREHGTYVKYVVDRCRCDSCRAANSAYERERQQRVEPPYVGAERAREHLAYLGENGIGLKSVSRITGLSHGTLSKLVYGVYGTRAPSKRVRRETEQKILAVSIHDGLDGTREPAGPTWAVINLLRARGWTKIAIAKAIGQGGPGLQISRSSVTRRNARAIRALLDEPVPVRFDRHGNRIEIDMAELERDTARRDAEAERRRQHRQRQRAEAEARAARREALRDGLLAFDDEPEPVEPSDPYELPEFAAGVDQPWRAQGSCRRPGVPTYLFFPAEDDHETLQAAREVCARCPVAADCLDHALRAGEEHGVWGGRSERERHLLGRRRAA